MTRRGAAGPARRAVELVLVAAALGLGAYLLYIGKARRPPNAGTTEPLLQPAASDGDSSAPRSVNRLPRVRLSTPPRPPKRPKTAVPEPAQP